MDTQKEKAMFMQMVSQTQQLFLICENTAPPKKKLFFRYMCQNKLKL